jgi:hypothetical protein
MTVTGVHVTGVYVTGVYVTGGLLVWLLVAVLWMWVIVLAPGMCVLALEVCPQVHFLIQTSLFYFVTQFLYIVSPSAGKTLDFSLWFSLARCVCIFDV